MKKEIRKLIKPYIVKRKQGYCCLLIPLGEWDLLLGEISKILGEVNKLGGGKNDVD